MKRNIQKGVRIKSKHSGSFAAFAQSLGRTVQGAALYVLANPHQFPSERIQQARLTRDESQWKKQEGGSIGQQHVRKPSAADIVEQKRREDLKREQLKALADYRQRDADDYKKPVPVTQSVDHPVPDTVQKQLAEEGAKKIGLPSPSSASEEEQRLQQALLRSQALRKKAELDRRAKAIQMADEVKEISMLSPQKWTRENLAKAGVGLGERGRIFTGEANNLFSWFDDHLNPLVQLGRMAGAMGKAPLRAQQTNSVVPYLTAVGTPLFYRAIQSAPFQSVVPFIKGTRAAQTFNDQLQNIGKYGIVENVKDYLIDQGVDHVQSEIDKNLEPDQMRESNEVQPTYAYGGMSTEGYKSNSPDRFNEFNIIPSNHITMQNVPHPVWGLDNTGASQLMMPGKDYLFPGHTVFELPLRDGANYTSVGANQTTHIDSGFEKNYKKNGGPINMSNSRKPIPRRRARYNSNAYMQSGGQPGYPLFPIGVNYVFPGQDAFTYPEAFQVGGEPTPRLVDTVPQDYHPYGQYQGRPTFAKDSGVTMPLATGHGSGGAQYDQFLMKKLASGVSPEELAEKKYIHPSQMERFRQYYKPSRDVVYTQPPVPPTPPPPPADRPVWGSSSVRLYDNRGHAYADAFYPSRSSSGQADPGTLNTAKQPARLQLLDRMGQYIPDQVYEVPGNVLDDMTGGTHSFHDTTGLSQYRVPSGNLSGRYQVGGQPRLVDQIPTGYHPDGQYQGRPTYSKDMGANLPMANGSGGQGGPAYEQFLIKQLAAGVTPDELAKKRYIAGDPQTLANYQRYYKPSRDVVYTQPPVPPPPPPPVPDRPVWGSSMVRFYDNRGHAFADGAYASRSSSGQADPGTLNTAKQPARLQLLDRMGQYNPNQVYEVPGNVLDSMTGGTHTFRDTTGLSQYRVPSANITSRYQMGGGYGPFFFRYL